jgi:hypothetical protein
MSKPLNLEVLGKSIRLSPRSFAALLASLAVAPEVLRAAGKSDVMLRGLTPAVGAVNVRPQYVGATSVRPYYPGGRVGAPAAMEQGFAQPTMQYSPQQYVAGDVTDFGIGRTTIPAGSTGTTFTIRPPRPFCPQMFICKSTVQDLLVKSISIAGTNILCGEDGVPVERFSEVSQAPQILFPTIDPSTGVTFTVSNPTLGDLVFSGSFYGSQVRV